MSGRGRSNRCHSRLGRSAARPANPNPTEFTLQDFTYYIGSAHKSADYDTATRFIINLICQEYVEGEDIAGALETMEQKDFSSEEPIRKKSTSLDDQERQLQDADYAILYNIQCNKFFDRTITYRQNLTKAFGLIWGRCLPEVQDVIKAKRNFTTKIKNNPIELLQAIKEQSIKCQDNEYPSWSACLAYENWFECKQKADESVAEYARRYRSARRLLEEQLGGPIIHRRYVESAPGFANYTPEEKERAYEEASDRLMACKILRNAEQTR